MILFSYALVLLLAPVQDPDLTESFPKMLENCKSKDNSVRLLAILDIGKVIPKLQFEKDKKAAAEILIQGIADPSVVVTAASKLRLAQNSEVVNDFLQTRMDDDNFRPFALGCEAIKIIGAPGKKWIKQIEKHLDSDDRNFRLASLHALAALDGEDILPLLDTVMESLESKDFNVQLSACRAISKMGPSARKAGPKLLDLLENGNASARSWASIALGAIGTHAEYDVVDLLEQRLDRFYVIDRQRALEGLAFLGNEAKSTLPKIKQLMTNPEKSVQHTAARSYWKITGDADAAADVLTKLVPTMVYGADAMDIIGEMGPAAKKAVPEIIKQLKSPEVTTREAACYALASIGPDAKAAIEPLQELKTDKDLLIRAVAEMAIEEITKSDAENKPEKTK